MELNDCVICLDKIQCDKIILECCHYYHNRCFSEYVYHNLSKMKLNNCIECPLCRKATNKIYIIYEILNILHDNKNKMLSLEKKRNILRKKLLLLNIKRFLYLKKNNILVDKEEEYMKKLEVSTNEFIEIEKNNLYFKKIYYNLIHNDKFRYKI